MMVAADAGRTPEHKACTHDEGQARKIQGHNSTVHPQELDPANPVILPLKPHHDTPKALRMHWHSDPASAGHHDWLQPGWLTAKTLREQFTLVAANTTSAMRAASMIAFFQLWVQKLPICRSTQTTLFCPCLCMVTAISLHGDSSQLQ